MLVAAYTMVKEKKDKKEEKPIHIKEEKVPKVKVMNVERIDEGKEPKRTISKVKQLIDQFERAVYREETPKLMMAGVKAKDHDELTYEDVFGDPFGEEEEEAPEVGEEEDDDLVLALEEILEEEEAELHASWEREEFPE